MPSILDPPPQDVVQELRLLSAALDLEVPAKQIDRNLLVATWNLRVFGDLTEKWQAEATDSPKRDLRSLRAIAEIISRFDVIAIQEVRGNIKSLRHMLKALGDHWGLIMTDVTLGHRGNNERMAFVFDTRRVRPSGLAGELVIPDDEDNPKTNLLSNEGKLQQFARTPYVVSFLAGKDTFLLITLHVLYGTKSADRLGELKEIAERLLDLARLEQSWGHNLICLGDFNIDRKDDAAYAAFTSTGLRAPPELDAVPRTIFDNAGRNSFYDQIAWFWDANRPALALRFSGKAGNFNFVGRVMPQLERQELSWRISDHYPLWVEFLTREP
jgi:endonuclease/exonuclease/phosphatase family metal-dependent hydrolase